jgi:hypothetical protein
MRLEFGQIRVAGAARRRGIIYPIRSQFGLHQLE